MTSLAEREEEEVRSETEKRQPLEFFLYVLIIGRQHVFILLKMSILLPLFKKHSPFGHIFYLRGDPTLM